MAPRATARGFTLIELLIAMAILSMVIGLASYSFSLFSRHWDGLRGDFASTRTSLQRVDLLSESLRDAISWAVTDESGAIGFYFLGRDDGFTLVTASPMFETEGPAVIRVLRERDPSSTGWQLVYEEAPLRGVSLRSANQTLPFSNRIVIAKGLTQLGFEYFGWQSTAERNQEADFVVAPRWFAEFDGLARRHHPLRVAIDVGGLRVPFELPDRDEALLGRAMVAE